MYGVFYQGMKGYQEVGHEGFPICSHRIVRQIGKLYLSLIVVNLRILYEKFADILVGYNHFALERPD